MYSTENRLDSQKVKATKKRLKETLIVLLQEKKLEQITVVEITDKAHLNRTTFYRYYLDVYDLYEQIVDEYAQVAKSVFPVYFRKIWRGEFTGLDDELVTYWEEHKEKLKVLLLQDHQLVERIKQGNMAYVREYLQIPISYNEKEQELTIENQQGNYPESTKEHILHIVSTSEDNHQRIVKSVKYKGESIKVKIK